MARSLRFVTLDVFTTQRYSGNQLGVVFLPSPDQALTQDEKQLIAREFNYSETIFVHPPTDDSSRTIDIFTTDEELPFAGHPTIGAVSWFLELSPNEQDRANARTLITKSGAMAMSRVASTPGAVAARIAHKAHIHAARFPLAEMLRLHPSLAPFFKGTAETGFPIISIVKGMSQIHVQLPNLEALAATERPVGGEVVPCTASSAGGYLDDGWEGNGLLLPYFYVPGVDDATTGKSVIRTRMFLRNEEDPATGSAASGLAAYLTLTSTEFASKTQFDYHMVQGVEMGRRSDIGLAVTLGDDKGERRIAAVELSGQSVQVMSGELQI
ncbi:hypothetical protein FE257_007126 [Aspergillus nanangensis]|uniref:Phenazine biosynthesis-like protein n=1 Tax=Aspergillus nanangensis TaxID=2582783 RepID=A0AAD4GVM3_ASPNN|nr:hypothetical protein FE257_007126 [Aspergillus nanangensis]